MFHQAIRAVHPISSIPPISRSYLCLRRMATRATPDLIKRLSDFSSCEVSDALIKLKSPHGGLIPDVDMFSPKRLDGDTKVIGEAFTVKMVGKEDKDAPKPEQHFVDAAEEDSVMVVSAPADVKSAIWGGLMTARAQARKVKGVVLDGRCRDLGEHREAQFPVFARGHSTLGQSPFTRPSELQVPVTIVPRDTDSFPAITVNPYDIVIADLDGVVVVPPKDAEEVVKLCTKGRAVDAKCMEDLKKGRGVKETFKEHRGS